MSDIPASSAAADSFRILQIKRHQMFLDGHRPHSPEIDAVEDEMTALWDFLTDEEQAALNREASVHNIERRQKFGGNLTAHG